LFFGQGLLEFMVYSAQGGIAMMPMLRRVFLKRIGAAAIGLPAIMRHPKYLSILSFPRSSADTWLEINLENISWNLAQIRQRVGKRPAMSLKARVMYLKTLRPGDSVSYHRAFVAEKETQVATIAVGYSDGYPHQAAQKAEALLAGKRWPTIALVTSNHATANTTGADEIKIGAEAVLFGRQGRGEISAEELAAWAGTSVYKILIGMNPLLPRKFIGG